MEIPHNYQYYHCNTKHGCYLNYKVFVGNKFLQFVGKHMEHAVAALSIKLMLYKSSSSPLSSSPSLCTTVLLFMTSPPAAQGNGDAVPSVFLQSAHVCKMRKLEVEMGIDPKWAWTKAAVLGQRPAVCFQQDWWTLSSDSPVAGHLLCISQT